MHQRRCDGAATGGAVNGDVTAGQLRAAPGRAHGLQPGVASLAVVPPFSRIVWTHFSERCGPLVSGLGSVCSQRETACYFFIWHLSADIDSQAGYVLPFSNAAFCVGGLGVVSPRRWETSRR